MTINQRIEAFAQLGNLLAALPDAERQQVFQRAQGRNSWFTPEQQQRALDGIIHLLQRTSLTQWVNRYEWNDHPPKKVGVVMAGNIPMVGFHDFLSVLISGHHLVAKTASQDDVLLPWIARHLAQVEPAFEARIIFQERLNGMDAVIATGSDNTSRYFDYYFRNIPHIIRKNRSSCAVIMGDEQPQDFEQLGRDVFSYYGLGCRNVSKLYLPEDFDPATLLPHWKAFEGVAHHHKYVNNYDYNKSIYLVNQKPFLDSGFMMLTESEALVSPISVVFYETYASQNDLKQKLEIHRTKIQCITSANGWYRGSVPFGKAQLPDLWDYADQIDTLDFLRRL